MKVLAISDGKVSLVERPTPKPVADQVLVKVAGTGINRADLLQKMGRYPAPFGWPADVPGLELAGTVEASGDRVRDLQVGDRVFGIVGGGAHSTHALTTEALLARVPDDMNLIPAGGVPEVFVTAHDAMLVQAGLRSGERVLIHGVGSGVGTAAVQLAKSIGAVTVGTSRTPDKLERARSLGLDEGVLASEDMSGAIGEVDVVIDLIGGDYLETDVSVVRSEGRIVLVGLVAGASARLDLGLLLNKRVSLRGTVLRARPDYQKAAAMTAFAREVVPLFATGTLRPVIDRIAPLAAADDAYGAMASDATFGKIVLAPEKAA